MKKKKISFKCPYQNFSCQHVDTSGMTINKPCYLCEHYNNGVIPTGGLINLRIKNWDIESYFFGFLCGVIFLAILTYFL